MQNSVGNRPTLSNLQNAPFYKARLCLLSQSAERLASIVLNEREKVGAAYRSGPLIALGKGQKPKSPAVTREAGEACVGIRR